MDGLASRSGASRAWITGVRSRSYGHWLRMRYEGIVVGWKTVQQDNPKLNVRRPDLPRCRSPHRIVLDPVGQGLRLSPRAAFAARLRARKNHLDFIEEVARATT